MENIQLNRIYKHCEGKTYYVRYVSKHIENDNLMVLCSVVDLESRSGLGALKSETCAIPYEMFVNEFELLSR